MRAQDQSALLNVVDLEAINGLLLNWHCEFQAPVEQNLEQQVFTRAVGLHAADQAIKFTLTDGLCARCDVDQVCRVNLKHAEADIQ